MLALYHYTVVRLAALFVFRGLEPHFLFSALRVGPSLNPFFHGQTALTLGQKLLEKSNGASGFRLERGIKR
jgi:hypothetical protein